MKAAITVILIVLPLSCLVTCSYVLDHARFDVSPCLERKP